MQYNCPVCNKAGLPDYTVTPTICPQCNSDLKPFLLLHSISKSNETKANKLVFFVIGLAVAVLAVFYFKSLSDKKQIAIEKSMIIRQLQDSVNALQTVIEKTQPVPTEAKSSEKEFSIRYKVKKGDYPIKIAQLFYNDWRMYKKIEGDNNLKQPYILKVGQPLTIKLNQ
jgi:hypothetical protein